MFDNTKKNGSGCFSEEELVSYLYGEIEESARLKFDSHLESCALCTDEFAGFSESRFSVYEWQRSTFAGLETPEITGPWQHPVTRTIATLSANGPTSWLGHLLRRPAFAFAAISLLLALGLVGVFYSNFTPKKGVVAASDGQTSTVKSPVLTATDESQIRPEQTMPKAKELPSVAVNTWNDRTKAVPQLAKVVANRSLRPRLKTEMASNDVKPTTSLRRSKAPRLGDFEEVEDNSVRLTDLFAEADTDKIVP